MLEYFESFDFSIFDKLNPKQIIEEHKNHENHLLTFGGQLSEREDIPIPETVEIGLRYVEQLVKAYNSDSSSDINQVEDILQQKHLSHFTDARKSFYKAEELRALSRDNLPEKVFENLKEDIYDGTSSIARKFFANGYDKVISVEGESAKVQIDSNPLKDACRPIDKKGLCHHLVNDSKFTWVEDDE